MPLVAGVDSSTSACKVEVRDADTGAVVASGRAPHPPTTPPRSEQDPLAWAGALDAAWVKAGADRADRPAAVAIAGQQHGLVVTDAVGSPLRDAKLWNDTESAVDAAELVSALGAVAWADACGSVPVASFTITKLRWLHRNEPELFERIGRIQLPHDWLTARLTGRSTTDRGDASGTGWWSPAESRYRYDLLELIDSSVDWEPLLPTVLGPTEPAGEHEGMVVAPGTGDNMAAALGLGLQPGDLALSLGTSGTAFTVREAPTADPSGIVAGFADASGRYLPLVCTLNATKVTDAVARLLGVDADGLDRLALETPPGSGGVVVVPHMDGERTPNRPGAAGVVSGLRSDVSRSQLARASFEGVVCNLLAGTDHLGVRPERLMLVGGGARSRAYRQCVADLSGLPVIVPSDQELVARGAAVQAAATLAGRSVDEVATSWPLEADVVEPDPAADRRAIREAYAEAARGAER